jgi:spermidine synthase
MIPAALAVFFASGFAALLYQVIWQRTLAIFSGADVHSATIVVAAFMAGLGCGSLIGGHVADRVSPRASLALFAAAEAAIATFGAASNWLFYHVLYERVGALGLGEGLTAVIVFVALLWPTFFMGVSLPLLARALTRDVGRAAPTVGWLYAGNTLGAAFGAICATWWVLPQVGLEGGVRIAAFLNLACAAAAVPLAAIGPYRENVPTTSAAPVANLPSPAGPRGARSASDLTFASWAALYALAGFLALSLEIVWFRLIAVMMKSTAFTFGTLLALYLFGLGTGAAIGSVLARRIRRPAIGFFALQAGAGVYAAISLTVFVTELGRSRSLRWFAEYFARYEALDIRAAIVQLRDAIAGVAGATAATRDLPFDFIYLYLVLPAVLIGPPTIMAGCSFPLLQRVVQTDLDRLGRRVGILMTANIAGSTLGAIVTGWLVLGLLGTAGTLKLALALSAVFALLLIRALVAGRPMMLKAAAYGATIALVIAIAVQMPAARTLWSRLHGASPRAIIFAEDGTGLSLLRAERDFSRASVFVNGLGQSWIPYGGIHTALGVLPAFVHPHPRTAALIGLGSGDTLYGLGGRRELERITSIEIIAPQLATLRELAYQQHYAGLRSMLDDPRIEHIVGDGRLFIRQAGRKYDIIEADALRPSSAYSGNLYSDGYFGLLLDHLNPGGLAVTWAPTERIARTFLSVFPYAWQHGEIMMGSNAPIDVDREAILRRLSDPQVVSYYARAGVNIQELLAPYLQGASQSFSVAHNRSGSIDINTDLHPKDEFDIPPLVDRSVFERRR